METAAVTVESCGIDNSMTSATQNRIRRSDSAREWMSERMLLLPLIVE